MMTRYRENEPAFFKKQKPQEEDHG